MIGIILVIPVIYVIVVIITEYKENYSAAYKANPWAGLGELVVGIFLYFLYTTYFNNWKYHGVCTTN